jgi:predicted membrane-bound spermidine synthase
MTPPPPSAPPDSAAAPPGEATLAALFCASGAAALAYQVCWQRLLFAAIGIDLYSVTVIVASFMLGLGVGSLAGGRLADALPGRLVVAFAAMEAGIGGFGLASLWLVPAVGDALVAAPLAVVALADFALLLVPTTLMGATLPVLVAHGVRRRRAQGGAGGEVGDATGRFYYANTLGACLGAALTGYVAFVFLTLDQTVLLAAAVNAAVAAAALAIYGRR